ncbi:hypothetical protein RchiOBHm_Chr1g0369881 [Rosa chinensis]|uniref:Uncharacterized protein n=1 Tax=Rosa chinensis TaxID=74649 RepID=A0A2P6SL64_ROSCH|nr:hypothetical protein RchiOBHm_Chr1g0369881 [Rosa chinensis]
MFDVVSFDMGLVEFGSRVAPGVVVGLLEVNFGFRRILGYPFLREVMPKFSVNLL